MRVSFFILIFSLIQGKALAYSPATHKSMVASAAQDYNYCIDVLNLNRSKLTQKQINKIINGNLREDINPMNKLKFWHFYHPEKDLGKGILGWGFASFTERYKEAQGKLKKRNALKAIGTMSHYIQDVTNPAHVAPIYHGLGDSFDFFDFKSFWPQKISKERCAPLFEKAEVAKKKDESSFLLVDEVTKNTLGKMQETILVSTNTHQGLYSWEDAFWSSKFGPASKQAGFGEYGFLGNTFGKPESGVDATTMSTFAQERVRAALDATVVLFFRELE